MKKCKNYEVCGFEGEQTDFYFYLDSRSGKVRYKNRCPPCFKAWNKERSHANYQKDRESVLKRQKAQRQNPESKERRRKYQRNYGATHRAEHQEYLQSYWKKPESRFKKARTAARHRGIDWLLSLEEFERVSSQPCYYCSNEFCNPVALGSGLDRLDNSKGYEMGNVVSCGKTCNTLKMNILTPEETKIAIKAILAYRLTLLSESPNELLFA
jgi:hypothetical protein